MQRARAGEVRRRDPPRERRSLEPARWTSERLIWSELDGHLSCTRPQVPVQGPSELAPLPFSLRRAESLLGPFLTQ